jgi:hypothetical protein
MVSMPARLLRNMATLLVLHGLKPNTWTFFPFAACPGSYCLLHVRYVIHLALTTHHIRINCKIKHCIQLWYIQREKTTENEIIYHCKDKECSLVFDY